MGMVVCRKSCKYILLLLMQTVGERYVADIFTSFYKKEKEIVV